jgi:polyisoprenoid-binding protein YceI
MGRSRSLRVHFGGQCRRLVAVLLLLPFGALRAATPVQDWRIDEAHTSIGFEIDAVGFPRTRGRFTHYSGRVVIDFEHPSNSSTSFIVEAASVDLGSQFFNDFVKGPALLDVAKFPMLSFTSTQVEKLDARTARITGNLTMLGVTRPITLSVAVDADQSSSERVVALLATGRITRSEFGMIFGLPIIDDTLEITVRTRATSHR